MATIRMLAVGAVLALVAWAAAAQARPQQPDDVSAASSSAATIRGIVQTTDTPARPLRRAVVTISSARLPVSISVITDDAGRFAVSGMAAGRVSLTAAKPGYLPGSYGSPGPGRPGTPLVLAGGETREVVVPLVRGAALAGTIRDGSGSPLEGLRVFAIDTRNPIAPRPNPADFRSSVESRGVVTDDRGMYRVYGLAPGDYFVVAVPASVPASDIAVRSTKEMDALLARLGARRAMASSSFRR